MKNLISSILLLSVVFISSAQGIDVFDMGQGTSGNVTPVSPYLMTGRLQDNVFLAASLGTGFYFGNDDGKGSEGGRAGLAWEISAGKWLTPFIGMRLQFGWMQARGHTASQSAYYYGSPDASGYYQKRFTINNYKADFLVNIRNLTQGYSNSRMWNCIPLVGAGIARSQANNQSIKEFHMNIGILNTLRISDRLDGTAEVRYMAINSRFDGISGKGLDGTLTLTFGIQYNFGRKGFTRPVQLIQ